MKRNSVSPLAPSAYGVRPVVNLHQPSDVASALLFQAQWDGGMPYARSAEVPGSVDDLLGLLPDDDAVLRLDHQDRGERTLVVELPGLLAQVSVSDGVTRVAVVGADPGATEALVQRISTAARELVVEPEDSLRMRFWSYGDGYGQMATRRVTAPAWSEASDNYARRTRQALSGLMSTAGVDDRAGRLVLWHGEPGTGKTTAVRALSRQWADWCQPHYVMDPEKLFEQPHYLLEVAGAHGEDEDADDGRWRLVIAEDCDEYLRADAKLRAGASLGRLLNLCDGILGHGLKVLVLLTTNEDVGRLHPAITRPGRCLSQVEFELLSPAEARSWLGSDAAPEGPVSLAALYAQREDRAPAGDVRAPSPGGYL
jgi:hypothetical protein